MTLRSGDLAVTDIAVPRVTGLRAIRDRTQEALPAWLPASRT